MTDYHSNKGSIEEEVMWEQYKAALGRPLRDTDFPLEVHLPMPKLPTTIIAKVTGEPLPDDEDGFVVRAGDMVYINDAGELCHKNGHIIGIATRDGEMELDVEGKRRQSVEVLQRGTLTIDPKYAYVPPQEIIYPEVSRWMKVRQEWVYWSWRVSETWKAVKNVWTK